MDNQSTGFFALYRKALDAPWARDPFKFTLWVRLISMASHKPVQLEFNGHQFDLATGQLVTSASSLASFLHDDGQPISKKKCQRLLQFFVDEGMIIIAGNSIGSVITVVNYVRYQNKPKREQNGQTKNNDVPRFVPQIVPRKPAPDLASEGETVPHSVPRSVPQINNNMNNNTNTPLYPPSGGDVAATVSEPETDTPPAPPKPRRKRKPAVEPITDFQPFVDAYHDTLGDRLPRIVRFNEKRQRALAKFVPLLATPNVNGWRAYLEAFAETAKPFYFGKGGGWIASVDFLMREETLEKVRSGEIAGGEVFG